MAIAHEPLQKPWMYLSLGSLALGLFWFIPIVLVIALIGLSPVGLFLLGLICFLLLVSLTIWAEITGLETCQVFNALYGEPEMVSNEVESARQILAKWEQVVLLVLSQPMLKLWTWLLRFFSKDSRENSGWVTASELMLPVIAIEDVTLTWGTARIKQIIEEKSLRFRPEFIRVNLIARCAQWLMLVIGVVAGVLVSVSLADPQTASTWQLIIGGGVGCLIGLIIMVVGLAFSSFIRACYHTSLLIWVKNTEKARQTGEARFAASPAILEQVLGRYASGKKEK